MGIASVVVIVVAAASVLLYALAARGNPSRQARLNDSGVWVSSNASATSTSALFGQIDVPADHLGAVLTPDNVTNVDLLQDGNIIAALDQQANKLTPIDPVSQQLNKDDAIQLGSAHVAIGGDEDTATLAAWDPAKGSIWAASFPADTELGNLAALDPAGAKPLPTRIGAQADVAVGDDGSIYAASVATGITTVTPKADGTWASVTSKLPEGLSGAVQITVVGTLPVVLVTPQGSTSPTLVLPGGKTVTLQGAGSGTVLQQVGPASATVLIADPKALLSVDLSTGAAPTTMFAGGNGDKAARPVYFQSCSFAAWAGKGAEEAYLCPTPNAATGSPPAAVQKLLPMADGAGVVTDLVFRHNHSRLLLNDLGTGQVWDNLAGDPAQVANWSAAKVPAQSTDQTSQESGNDQQKPPVANPDTLGARAGRATVLHVLDNDTTPQGTVLTVNAIEGWASSSPPPVIAPDRQSITLTLPADASGSYTFRYDVSNGTDQKSNKAAVTVNVVAPDVYAIPKPRATFTPTTFAVPVNGVITIPVLADWRVNETGDPPALGALNVSAVTAQGASAITTADGSIVYSAGAAPGADVITYTVVDGNQIATAKQNIVIASRDDKPTSPTVQNDYVHLVVGQPQFAYPLANDLPGADPLDPAAGLQIAGTIKSIPNLSVGTPTASGGVLLTASKAGTFTLHYQDGYGSAPVSNQGVIRVDVDAPDPKATVVAAPDSVTARGLAPALFDPLANDSSPSGGLLTVVGVQVNDNSNLAVAVVKGHWLRVNQRESQSKTETFTYSVTDGTATTSAQVTVVELPALANDVPVTVTDYATVRAGDSVLWPVLDNDYDPAGDALALVANSDAAKAPGQLPVSGDSTTSADQLGSAFVSGDQVRYVAASARPSASAATQAPGAATARQQVTVTYIAQNSSGQSVPGKLIVTIVPALAADDIKSNAAPVPDDLEARVVAGGTVTIPVPTSGIDPDGDTVQVQGLALPQDGDPQPKFGAVIAYTANSLTYQAYPTATNAGTDNFVYEVSDTYGVTSRATVRVAVVQPTVLPAPVAHNVTITAAPGTDLRLHVVSPQFVDYPDGAEPRLLDPKTSSPDGKSIAELDASHDGWLIVHVPAGKTGDTATLVYAVEPDLGAPVTGEITLNLDENYKAPPVVVDEFAKPAPGATGVEIDLLAGDYSPVGAGLSVEPPAVGTVSGGKLSVQLTGMPQVIPFVVKDDAGATASAVAYVPATGANAVPYWNGKTITIPAAKTTDVDIADYVVDPQNKALSLTTQQQRWTSPAALTAAVGDTTKLALTGGTGEDGKPYQGPASVTFAVTRTTDLNAYTLITIPVVVGNPTPVLRCPTDIVDVQEGLVDGAAISPRSQCHVWTPPSVDPASLKFHLAWQKDPGLVSFKANDAARDVLFADHNAKPDNTGVLTVTVVGYGSTPSQMNVRIVTAPQLKVSPISVKGVLTTGRPTKIDLSSYVSSPFGFGAVSILKVGTIANTTITHDKGSITITATKKELNGTFPLSYTVTDLDSPNDTSRWKSGNITIQFIGVPGAPTAVTPRPGYLPAQVPLTWTAPPANGSAIDLYEVDYTSADAPAGNQSFKPSQPWVVTGLKNGSDYRLTVKAHNQAGWGDPSALSGVGTPDQIPAAVVGFAASNPQDHAITLTWKADTTEASADQFKYRVRWTGGTGSGSFLTSNRAQTTYTVTGIDNDAVYTFYITDENRAGVSAEVNTTGQSAGKPAAPTLASSFTPTKTAAGKAAVAVSWGAVTDPNGPGPVTYTLTRSGGGGDVKTVCAKVTDNQCTDSGVDTQGQFYDYQVTAANTVFPGPASAPAHVEITVPPDQISDLVTDAVHAADPDDTVTIHFTTVPSNGASLTAHCAYTIDGSTPTTSATACQGSPWGGFATTGGTAVTKTLAGFKSGQSSTPRFLVWEDNGSTKNTQYKNGNPSAPTAPVSTNAPPATPTANTCGLSGTNVTYKWSAETGTNGRTISYEVTGDHNGTVTDNSVTVSHGQDYVSHSVTVTAVDSFGDHSGSVGPITCPDALPDPPSAPTVNISQSGTNCTFTWAATSTIPEGGSLSFVLSGANGGTTTATSWSHDWGQDGAGHTLYVQVSDGHRTSPQGTATCNEPQAPPPPPPTVSWGKTGTCTGICATYCTNGSCSFINVTLTNFPGAVSCSINSAHGQLTVLGTSNTYTFTAGNGTTNSQAFYGYPGTWVQATCGGYSSPQVNW
jgi:hypothetical protein